MLAIEVDLDGAVPIYQQIADGIRGLIARGALSDGAVLPSVRRLGASIGVNLNTVARAYRILGEEGLVEVRQGAPARVRTAERKGARRKQVLDEDARRKLFGLFSRWTLEGATQKQIERALESAATEFFA